MGWDANFLADVAAIIWLDIVLSGDNALVIGMAAAAQRAESDRELYDDMDNGSPNVAMGVAGAGAGGDEKSPNVDSVYHSVGGGDDAQMGG